MTAQQLFMHLLKNFTAELTGLAIAIDVENCNDIKELKCWCSAALYMDI